MESDEEKKALEAARKKAFEDVRTEIWKREISNAEKFDSAILTYSSAGLAVSLALLKDFIPISQADIKFSLYLSWGLFVCAIVSVILSFFFSKKGLSEQLDIAEEYYIKCNEDVFNRSTKIGFYTDWSAYIAGICFILAVICSTIFVSFNLKGAELMSERKIAYDGASIPTLHKMQSEADLKKAQPIPALQKIVPSSAQQQPSQPQPNGPASETSK
jgi:hypothetical protein